MCYIVFVVLIIYRVMYDYNYRDNIMFDFRTKMIKSFSQSIWLYNILYSFLKVHIIK